MGRGQWREDHATYSASGWFELAPRLGDLQAVALLVPFWGALAMGVTAGVGALFGTASA